MTQTAGRRTPGTRVQSVDRAAVLLEAVAVARGPAASATALAEAVGLNRTTTWRLLTTLQQHRLVSVDRGTGWWSLGFGLLDLAAQVGDEALARSAQVVLEQLAARAGETAALAVMRTGALTYVAEASPAAVVSAGWRGREVSVHATSTGKVLLAWSDPADVRLLLDARDGRLSRHTDTTVTSVDDLLVELAETRERGWAVCRGEFEASAWGVSAPVLDASGHLVAVVSLWGPSTRLTEARFDDLGPVAVWGAAEIAGRRASGGS